MAVVGKGAHIYIYICFQKEGQRLQRAEGRRGKGNKWEGVGNGIGVGGGGAAMRRLARD